MTDTPKPPPRALINLRLSQEVTDYVDRMATAEQRSRSQMLRILISEAVTARTKR